MARVYMKECSALWIVAPITRAVDDKAAQDIMGASFNRQLQLDGNLSNVTFICSKTDDILITEAIKNLGAQAAEADDVNTQIKAMGEQAKEKELVIRIGQEKVTELKRMIKLQDEEIEAVQKGLNAAGNDALLVTVCSRTKKRQLRAADAEARKRVKLSPANDDSALHPSSSSDDDDDSDAETITEERTYVRQDASTKLETLQVSKKESKAEEKKTSKEVKKLRKEVAIIKADIKAKKSSLLQMCISSRNSYSRPAIQAQFARGLKL